MSSQIASGYPEIKGYRIRQVIRNEQDQSNVQETLLKVILKNCSNGIPKIRNDVICNGKHYPYIPLFSFTSQEDLKILEQISTIVLRDQNEILCQIISGKIKEVRVSQFKELRLRLKYIFDLDLTIEPEELFLLLVSDEISNQIQFNDVFDSISETQFVNLIKKIYENCPSRAIPKILRKISKYFNSTKVRTKISIQRLKKILKTIKSADQSPEFQKKEEQKQLKTQQIQENNEEEWIVVQPKTKKQPSTKKQQIYEQQKNTQVQQKTITKTQAPKSIVNKKAQEQIPVELQKITKKITQTQKVKKTEKVTKKQKLVKTEKIKPQKKIEQKDSQNDQNWEDIESQNGDSDENIEESLGKMAFKADQSDEDLKYVGPKKKSKKKNNLIVSLDPEFDTSLGKKPPNLKKQKKNQNNIIQANLINQGKPRKSQQEQEEENTYDRKVGRQNIKDKFKNGGNNRNNNQQSLQRGGRQFSKEKKLDSRILLGINGASDAVWREKMRPPRYPNKQNINNNSQRAEDQNRNWQEKQPKGNKAQIKTQKFRQKPQENQYTQVSQQQSKNLTLKKIFSIPEDVQGGKHFKFEKRSYNLFVNKLFWVNISDGTITVQKDGKGYIRKCPVQIIDNGKGIMADGLTINTDGLSNLQDGGTAFGDPVFEEFAPNGQWFHVTQLDVFAYV